MKRQPIFRRNISARGGHSSKQDNNPLTMPEEPQPTEGYRF